MTNPVVTTFLSPLVYPLILTGVGVLGNAYVLGAQVQDVQHELKDVQHDIRDIQKDIKGLLARQIEQEARTTTLMQRYMKGSTLLLKPE